MPCFDKKLEASRSDFYNDLYKTRDVDCVITSGEEASFDDGFIFTVADLQLNYIVFYKICFHGIYRRGGDYATGQRCCIGNIRVTTIR